MAHLTGGSTPHIAIVGGGFAGTLTLAHLVRGARGKLHITLIEKGPNLARGTAYSTAYPYHLLNVRTDRMGAFPDAPGDFYEWLQSPEGKARTAALCPQSPLRADNYVPRLLYGAYLDALLQQALAEGAGKGLDVSTLRAEVTAVAQEGQRLQLVLAGGAARQADTLVLATGNAPPRRFGFLVPVADNPALVEDIWEAPPFGLHADRMAGLTASSHVCIIGSGLTAVDAVLTLHHHGYRGRITLLSRHGLLPAVHTEGFTLQPPHLAEESSGSALGLLAALRAEIKATGGDWRALVDGVRPSTTTLWQKLPEREKKRFLTRLFSFWNVHRHRMAPEIGAVLDELKQQGRLQVLAGSIRAVAPIGAGLRVTYRPAHAEADATLEAEMLINCAGPDYDVTSPANLLLAGMCEAGLLIPSPLRWGVKLESNGAAQGKVAGKIFPLGTLRIEEELECTAVPELRGQAKQVADAVLRRLV